MNRISLFCSEVYFKKKKINKKDFFLLYKNYGSGNILTIEQEIKRAHWYNILPTNNNIKLEYEIKQLIFDSFFVGHSAKDYKEKFQELFEDALMEPFAYFRSHSNTTVYPKNFDI